MQCSNPLQELRDALKRGTSLDELWKVARGEIQYRDFLEESQGKKQSKMQPNRSSVEVPDDLASSTPASFGCRSLQRLSLLVVTWKDLFREKLL